jgi:hypothetical protein
MEDHLRNPSARLGTLKGLDVVCQVAPRSVVKYDGQMRTRQKHLPIPIHNIRDVLSMTSHFEGLHTCRQDNPPG